MIRRHYFLMLIALFASTTLWAVAEPTGEELAQQRRRLADARKHPEQIARLREHLKAYLDLPEKRREAIAKLDRDLHDLAPKKQERLRIALERYADWLDQMSQKDPPAYQAIKGAPDASARLALIKEYRDREWMATQPRTRRDEWQRLPPAGRGEFVAKLRQEDRRKHEQWVIAKRFWVELEKKKPMPTRLSDFVEKSDKVKKYVDEYLWPTLTAEEKKQLSDAEGRWPDYPQALVAIASKHPSALPTDPPHKFAQLPLPVQHKLIDKKTGGTKKGLQKEILQYEGPSFASKVVAIGLREGKLPFGYEYLAANDKSLLLPMKDFVETKLMPALKDNPEERRRLTDNLGKWPDYPQTIQALSDKYHLHPPWHILPDPDRWNWDWYRGSKVRSWGSELAKEKKIP